MLARILKFGIFKKREESTDEGLDRDLSDTPESFRFEDLLQGTEADSEDLEPPESEEAGLEQENKDFEDELNQIESQEEVLDHESTGEADRTLLNTETTGLELSENSEELEFIKFHPDDLLALELPESVEEYLPTLDKARIELRAVSEE